MLVTWKKSLNFHLLLVVGGIVSQCLVGSNPGCATLLCSRVTLNFHCSLLSTYNHGQVALENVKNMESIVKYLQKKCQHPHSPFQCWKMVKCKLMSDESVLSTLHRGGEGQNVYRMIFSKACEQGCSCING